MAGKLTEARLRAWVRHGKPLSAKADGGGLYFRIHDSGIPQWYFRYSFAGRKRWLFLGNYPDTSLSDARKACTARRADVDKGLDPARERQRQKAEAATAQTVAQLGAEWYGREIEPRYKFPEVVRRTLEKHVYPVIGGLTAKDVTPRHVDDVLHRLAKADKPAVANDALRYMRRMFAYGRKRRLVDFNPAADFTLSDAGGQERARTRALSTAELQALFKALRDTASLGRPNELAFKVLLATCVRKGELIGAKWSEFDLAKAVWHLPGRTKTKQALNIPLAAPVVGWLQELKVFAAGSEYVLPARRLSEEKRHPHVSPSTLNVALARVEHDLEHFTVHDMRRTARTHLAALGVPSEIAERALNHKLRGVEGVYNRHDYFGERKQALEVWASVLQAAESGKKSKVVPFRFAGAA